MNSAGCNEARSQRKDVKGTRDMEGNGKRQKPANFGMQAGTKRRRGHPGRSAATGPGRDIAAPAIRARTGHRFALSQAEMTEGAAIFEVDQPRPIVRSSGQCSSLGRASARPVVKVFRHAAFAAFAPGFAPGARNAARIGRFGATAMSEKRAPEQSAERWNSQRSAQHSHGIPRRIENRSLNSGVPSATTAA